LVLFSESIGIFELSDNHFSLFLAKSPKCGVSFYFKTESSGTKSGDGGTVFGFIACGDCREEGRGLRCGAIKKAVWVDRFGLKLWRFLREECEERTELERNGPDWEIIGNIIERSSDNFLLSIFRHLQIHVRPIETDG
jgi:hypothetical protein